MEYMNKVILCGMTGKEPEIRKTPAGTIFANVSLATTERWKDKQGNKQEKTEWHNLSFSEGLANIVEKYVHKGDKLLIEGKISYRKYTNKEGKDVCMTEIKVVSMEMLSTKSKSEPSNKEERWESAEQSDLDDSIIPFN